MIIYLKTDNIKITEGLALKEFKCKCDYPTCLSVPIDPIFVKAFTNFRALIELSIYLTNGHRCQQHNFDVGGSPTSYHLYGQAMDFIYSGDMSAKFLPSEIEHLAFTAGFRKIIWYPDKKIFHADIRGERGR